MGIKTKCSLCQGTGRILYQPMTELKVEHHGLSCEPPPDNRYKAYCTHCSGVGFTYEDQI